MYYKSKQMTFDVLYFSMNFIKKMRIFNHREFLFITLSPSSIKFDTHFLLTNQNYKLLDI